MCPFSDGDVEMWLRSLSACKGYLLIGRQIKYCSDHHVTSTYCRSKQEHTDAAYRYHPASYLQHCLSVACRRISLRRTRCWARTRRRICRPQSRSSLMNTSSRFDYLPVEQISSLQAFVWSSFVSPQQQENPHCILIVCLVLGIR